MQEPSPLPASQRPHPVVFDVEYPVRLSRGLIFVKWLLAIPHYIVVYILSLVLGILTFLAWFAILFTGRYPKAFFTFNQGVLRWMSNVFAYVWLLRDEYPPFSFDAGLYPLLLDIPRAERQSRFRLFIRFFAIIPNYIVFYFIQLAGFVTTFIAWWAILFTGRHPRGLFRFNVGMMRWYARQTSYLYLLRDEYPPYSISAEARPGNEVVSAIIGAPLAAGYIALNVVLSLGVFVGDGETVQVAASPADAGSVIARTRPTASGGGLEVTLADYDPNAISPGGGRAMAFDIEIEHDAWHPSAYVAWLFNIDYCELNDVVLGDDDGFNRLGVDEVTGSDFEWFWRGGTASSTIYFDGPPTFCALEYFLLGEPIRFEFE